MCSLFTSIYFLQIPIFNNPLTDNRPQIKERRHKPTQPYPSMAETVEKNAEDPKTKRRGKEDPPERIEAQNLLEKCEQSIYSAKPYLEEAELLAARAGLCAQSSVLDQNFQSPLIPNNVTGVSQSNVRSRKIVLKAFRAVLSTTGGHSNVDVSCLRNVFSLDIPTTRNKTRLGLISNYSFVASSLWESSTSSNALLTHVLTGLQNSSVPSDAERGRRPQRNAVKTAGTFPKTKLGDLAADVFSAIATYHRRHLSHLAQAIPYL